MSGLRGKRIVITRAPHQAGEFAALLEARGAIPLLYPCIDIAPPEDTDAMDTALRCLDIFDWLVLTSVNTVIALQQRITALALPTDLFAKVRVAAVGPATAAAARDRLEADIHAIPEDFIAEALAQAVQPAAGSRIYLPQSSLAETTLANALRTSGAEVVTSAAYRTVCASGGIDLPHLLAAEQIDAITFTSASTVTYCMERLAIAGRGAIDLNQICIACIGPKTAAAAAHQLLGVDILPAEHTLEALVSALETFFFEETRRDVDRQ